MPRRKSSDLLSHLDAEERSLVLTELLESHPELLEQANTIAQILVDDVTKEDIAWDVADCVTGVDLEEVNSRSGSQPWGYVKPGEASWELLDEAIADVRAEMIRKHQGGMEAAAETACQGIVMGLHEVRNRESDGALGWAQDFPRDAAAQAVFDLVEKYPAHRRKAAGRRIIAAVRQSAEDWVEMLERAVRDASRRKQERE